MNTHIHKGRYRGDVAGGIGRFSSSVATRIWCSSFVFFSNLFFVCLFCDVLASKEIFFQWEKRHVSRRRNLLSVGKFFFGWVFKRLRRDFRFLFWSRVSLFCFGFGWGFQGFIFVKVSWSWRMRWLPKELRNDWGVTEKWLRKID